jgi:hypothetical protein
MNARRSVPEKYESIIERLRNLPDVSPPAGLRRGIMASLSPKKPGLWARWRRIWFEPRTVTFVPIKWAPVLAGLLMLAVIPRLPSIDGRHAGEMPPVKTQQASLTFTFEYPGAQNVALIGTFNRWMPDGRVRTEKKGDRWIFHIDVDPGRYEYAFLVDGRDVIPDPLAVFQSNNGFGTPNSIVYATADGQNNI